MRKVSTTYLECQLPAGTGFDQPVVVSAEAQISPPLNALSYASPKVTELKVRSVEIRAICHEAPTGTASLIRAVRRTQTANCTS